MKMVLAIILMVGTASATSIRLYDRWSCTFGVKTSGPITGTAVNIEYNLSTGKGKAIMYPICRACMVQPREIAIERSGNYQYLTYKNQMAGFFLNIATANVPMPGAPHYAQLGKDTGSCFPK